MKCTICERLVQRGFRRRELRRDSYLAEACIAANLHAKLFSNDHDYVIVYAKASRANGRPD